MHIGEVKSLAQRAHGDAAVREELFAALGSADPAEAVGIRALCLKLAYAQCRHWPELRAELRQVLLGLDRLKPGLKSTSNKIIKLL